MTRILFGLLLSVMAILYADQQSIEIPISNGERHIVVVIASYNNSKYVVHNLKSVFDQTYTNYHVIYVDDCSTDATLAIAKRYAERCNKTDKVHFIHNQERKCALYNQYHAIHLCRDTDLIVVLDGDDWFSDKQVLSFLNTVYNDTAIWLTYGQFIQYPTGHRSWGGPMPEEVIQSNGFREYVHAPCHLRTFYAGLFKQIKKDDLIYEGDFFKMTGDNAFMFPMIEMAREGHFRFISRVLMMYNTTNPISDHLVVQGLQQKLDLIIRARQKYDPINTPFLTTKGELW